jgi:hypothetical protein
MELNISVPFALQWRLAVYIVSVTGVRRRSVRNGKLSHATCIVPAGTDYGNGNGPCVEGSEADPADDLALFWICLSLWAMRSDTLAVRGTVV